MGFFSFKTNNTCKSISNASSSRGSFPVVVIDNNQNYITERNYEGYGVFGGKDIFETIADMNKELVSMMLKTNYSVGKYFHSKNKRDAGHILYNFPEQIKLSFHEDIIYPNILEWNEEEQGIPPKWKNETLINDNQQGFFY